MSDIRETQTSAGKVPAQAQAPEPMTAPAPASYRAEAPAEPTGWVGWVVFGAIMMIMVGSFHVLAGLVALFNSGYYLVGPENLLVNVDFTAWGWTHIVLGALAVVAAFGILAGKLWARIAGIGLAVLSALVNLAFIAAYPWWSVIAIALDVVVIYAIAVHGEELESAH